MPALEKSAIDMPKHGRPHALSEYQRQLAERTMSARHSPSAAQRQLGFVAAGRGWLIDISDAAEILPTPPVARVPNTQAWFLGLINYRGALAGVIDFEIFLGQPQQAVRHADRLIVLSEKFSLRCALRVTEICGLMNLSSAREQQNTIPANASWMGPPSLHEGRQWHPLNLHSLLDDARLNNAALTESLV